MYYQKFPPCSALLPFVECYYIWEDDHAGGELTVESPPSAYSAMVFNDGDPYAAASLAAAPQTVPRQFIAGQLTHSYTLHLSGRISIAAIVFRPAGIASLFRIPMFAFTNERTDLRAVLDEQEIQTTAEAIHLAGDGTSKAACLEAFVLRQYEKHRPEPDRIDFAANTIVDRQGQVQIQDLCNSLFLSRRQFERRFLQKVGLSAKYYARMRRIGYICAQMAGRKEVNWQELYYSLDYYDQSHFIKDFTEFTGRTPSEYFQGNAELIHHLKDHS